ncbi:MAG: KEOPS complex subunit Cgi121 [Candidatus Bathyarchaeia archaeon]
MIKYLKEFDKYVAIAGFRNVKIDNVENFLEDVKKHAGRNVEAQFLDAELVATWQHLYFAVLNALTAFRNSENVSKSLALETLLYASAQRQIRKAMQFLGVKKESEKIALVVIGEKADETEKALTSISKVVNGQRDDTVLELCREKIAAIKKAFDISDFELEAVAKKDNLEEAITDIVVERVALSATTKKR